MNSAGAEMLPIRLVISVALIAAVCVLLAVATSTLHSSLAEHQIQRQCQNLESSLSTMMRSGVPRDVDDRSFAEGTKRVQKFTFPESLIYLSFGGDPDPLNSGVLTTDLLEDGAAIVYRIDGGGKHILWLPKEIYRFRAGNCVDNTWVMAGDGESFIVTGGGTITLMFECVLQNQIIYILVYPAAQ